VLGNTQAKATISKRAHHGAVQLGNNLLIFGGYRFGKKTKKERKKENEKISTFGFGSKTGGNALKDVWKLILGKHINGDDVSVLKIESFSPPSPRYGHTITRMGTKIFVIGGQHGNEMAVNHQFFFVLFCFLR
jgi:hypothetical protein